MRKRGLQLLMVAAVFIFTFTHCTAKEREFTLLQFNIWMGGNQVPNGYDAIINQIIDSEADFVTLSEVRNYEGKPFHDCFIKSLAERGAVYYSFYSEGVGLLSKYPIVDSTLIHRREKGERNGFTYRALIDANGVNIALYTTHLDYLHYACYDPKGYSGTTWKPAKPVLSEKEVLRNSYLSTRDRVIKKIIPFMQEDVEQGRLVFLGGDFNEPSHLDWIEENKDMYDRNGVVVSWPVSSLLYEAGFLDAYRVKFPNPLTHPGFTYPSDNPLVDVSKLAWAPGIDERERIDFIYYAPCNGLEVKEAKLWGPLKTIRRSERSFDEGEDPITIGVGEWPSDHRAVWIKFSYQP